VAAHAVTRHEPAGDLVVPFVDAVAELRLERPARGAGDLDVGADEAVRAWLLNIDGQGVPLPPR
jgi:hypothetical protein